MNYKMEELIPVAAMLTELYTSKESSSVTYETAQMLMEAVIYCVEECARTENDIPAADHMPDVRKVYEKGYKCVVEKVYKAKEIYDRLISDFEDYGCRNYKDTILKGMPRFFLLYDARFEPQNHILTLDYPSMSRYDRRCGTDLIFQYLRDIETESRLLSCFDAGAVRRLLAKTEERFDICYMDNICSLVLLNAVGCMIAERSFSELTLGKEDVRRIEIYFLEDSLESIERKTGGYVRAIIDAAGFGASKEHFLTAVREYAIRIHNGTENGSLDAVFM